MRDKKLNIDKIWIEYHPKIQVYLKQISPEKDNYEDMASEVLLSVFENLDNYNNDYSLSTWIYTIARNRQIDYIRKTKHQLIEYKEELDFHENTPEQELINHYDIIQIRYAITRLKPEQRELIYLYYYEDLNYREINSITGVPQGTLKCRMFNARKSIKEIINRSENNERDN